MSLEVDLVQGVLAECTIVVIQALQTNGIKFVSFDRGGKLGGDIVEEFQQDESIKVFLLHAERERYVLSLAG